MDNLSTHKIDGARERVEATGARLPFPSPYSPDLNPIEQAWPKPKQLLRARKARWVQALGKLLPSVTAQDAHAWFRLRLGSHTKDENK